MLPRPLKENVHSLILVKDPQPDLRLLDKWALRPVVQDIRKETHGFLVIPFGISTTRINQSDVEKGLVFRRLSTGQSKGLLGFVEGPLVISPGKKSTPLAETPFCFFSCPQFINGSAAKQRKRDQAGNRI